MYKKILVPPDASPLVEVVLPHVQALTKSEGAEIVLLRVAVAPEPNFFHRDVAESMLITDTIEEEALDYMKTEVVKLQNDDAKVTDMTRDGLVPDTILGVAEEIVHASHIPVMLICPSLN
jgi:nucleotide-binding universal stress UspA family protein